MTEEEEKKNHLLNISATFTSEWRQDILNCPNKIIIEEICNFTQFTTNKILKMHNDIDAKRIYVESICRNMDNIVTTLKE